MTSADGLKVLLSRTFSEAIDVRVVPSGLAVRSPFTDGSGDPLTFYVRETGEGFELEDDGDYLPHLIASGIDIESGQRRQLLESVLSASGAYLDTDTLEIRSQPTTDLASASIGFLSALMRIRDLELLTKDAVRSTFRDDAIESIELSLWQEYEVRTNAPVGPQFPENLADVVLIPKTDGGRRVAVFLVNNSTAFVEAELLHSEIQKEHMGDRYASAALIEDFGKVTVIGQRRFLRAHNRGLHTSFFRGDEEAAMTALSRVSLAA